MTDRPYTVASLAERWSRKNYAKVDPESLRPTADVIDMRIRRRGA